MLFLIEKMGLMIRWDISGAFILLSAVFFWKCFLHRLKRTGCLEFLYLFLVIVLCLSVFMFLIGIGSLFWRMEIEESTQSFSMWGHGITGFRLGVVIKILLPLIWMFGSIRHMILKWNWRKKMEGLYAFNEVITDQTTIDSFTYAVLKNRLRREPMLFQNQAVSVPFLKGVIHPAVILPEKEFTSNEKILIFAHELSHLRSGDLLIRYLLELVFLIYWFVPFEDYLLEELIEIQESLCDISVCRTFGESFSAERYYSMIMNLSSEKEFTPKEERERITGRSYMDARMTEDIGHLEKRIINMLGHQSYKKNPFFQAASCTVIGVILFLFLCVSMLDCSRLFHGEGKSEEIIIRNTDDFCKKMISSLETPQHLLKWNDTVEYQLEPGESVTSNPFIGEEKQPLIICAVGEHKDYIICVEYNNEMVEIEAKEEATSLNLEMEEREYVLSLVNTGEENLKIFLYCNY